MRAQADPTRAAAQQSYMKSSMPFHGLTMPVVRAISREVFADLPPLDCAGWRDRVLVIWRGAKFREERYAALVLAADRRYASCRTPDSMPMLEELVVTGAWWDLVDETAHLVGDIVKEHPDRMKPLMRAWSQDPDLWKRRVSIICQLSFRKDTDLDLLYGNIERNVDDRDFFNRKAIGWALRSYARTDPSEVARYVRENESRLSGLSRREALKNLGPDLRYVSPP
jgi:3-methyladenine DNA glycosylase AlkD